MVGKNLVDLGVITLPKDAHNMVILKIWKDPLSLVFVKGHPLGSLQTVRLKDAVNYGMILNEPDTETRRTIDDAFSHKKLTPNVTMEVAYIETIKGLVKTGLGISILPDKAVESEVRNGELGKARIADADLARNLGVVYLKDKFLSRPANEFLKILSNA
jgi:DNA-binding transcriptional LysR family regulator